MLQVKIQTTSDASWRHRRTRRLTSHPPAWHRPSAVTSSRDLRPTAALLASSAISSSKNCGTSFINSAPKWSLPSQAGAQEIRSLPRSICNVSSKKQSQTGTQWTTHKTAHTDGGRPSKNLIDCFLSFKISWEFVHNFFNDLAYRQIGETNQQTKAKT